MTSSIAVTRDQLCEIPLLPRPIMNGRITRMIDRMAVEERIVGEFIERHGRKPHMAEAMSLRL